MATYGNGRVLHGIIVAPSSQFLHYCLPINTLLLIDGELQQPRSTLSSHPFPRKRSSGSPEHTRLLSPPLPSHRVRHHFGHLHRIRPVRSMAGPGSFLYVPIIAPVSPTAGTMHLQRVAPHVSRSRSLGWCRTRGAHTRCYLAALPAWNAYYYTNRRLTGSPPSRA
jgi:hypothetical protein